MSQYQQPDASGHFGQYGGSFISETLTHAISELKDAYAKYQNDPEFIAEFKYESMCGEYEDMKYQEHKERDI